MLKVQQESSSALYEQLNQSSCRWGGGILALAQ